MKLSELSTDKLADCLCDLTEPVSNIMQDEEIVNKFKDISADHKKGTPMIEIGGKALSQMIPLCLKKHRENVYKILSALSGKTIEEIGSQNGLLTIKEIKDCYDKDLVNFFKSSEVMEETK